MSEPKASQMSDYDIRREGWQALTERLGVSGAMRFLAQYDPGGGDYTQERSTLFASLSLEDALRRIEASGGGSASP